MSDTTDSPVDSAELENLERLMRQAAAGHWPEAKIDGEIVHLGFADLRISCNVDQVLDYGKLKLAVLYFSLAGGALGESGQFCSFSGYGPSAAEAVVEGTCHFCCCLFSAVLHGLDAGEHAKQEAQSLTGKWQGLDFRVHVTGFDRRFDLGSGLGPEGGSRELLISQLLASGRLPRLSSRHPSLISVFVSDLAGKRDVEVKVNGVDWLPAAKAFEAFPADPGPWGNFYRELALLRPQAETDVFDRPLLAATAAGLTAGRDGGPRQVAGWRGFASAGTSFLPPLSEEEVAQLESQLAQKKLPADYRRFLREVAGGGAGPGYGLLAPNSSSIASLGGRQVLLLAHAGCGALWVLLVEGPQAGAVAVYHVSQEHLQVVAGSFAEWYEAFWNAAVRDEHFVQHEARYCAAAHLLSNILNGLEARGIPRDQLKVQPESVQILTEGQPFYGEGETLDPCATCIRVYARFGLAEDVFRKGLPPQPARSENPHPGVLRRLWGSLTGRPGR